VANDRDRSAERAAAAARQERRANRLSASTRRMLPVIGPVIVAGAAALVASVWALVTSTPSAAAAAGTAALLLAAAIAEALPVPLEGVVVGRTSLATVFIVGSAVLYGWAEAILVAALAMAAVEIARRRHPSRTAYNTAVYALAAAAAGGVAEAVGGSSVASQILATLLAATAFYLVDITLVAVVVGNLEEAGFLRLLGGYVYGTLAPFGVMGCLAVILVLVWNESPFAAVVLAGPLAALVVYERWVHDALGRLRELDRLKDEFIAVVSHELRTPLASVYGASMTLQRAELDPEMRDSLLGIIHQESARLARLVDQVRWTSQLESERRDQEPVPIDAAALTQEVVESARIHLPEGLTVELLGDPRAPDAAGDPERMKQVLLNLVENAVKYSPDGGRIEVSYAGAGEWVRFGVKDEGLGIPADELERIFEKFHRVDPNLTRGVGGTGLGLYICRQLVEQMHGHIRVTSELGRGSTFVVELPQAAADEEPG
jgi:signal transduction histidine kinase